MLALAYVFSVNADCSTVDTALVSSGLSTIHDSKVLVPALWS